MSTPPPPTGSGGNQPYDPTGQGSTPGQQPAYGSQQPPAYGQQPQQQAPRRAQQDLPTVVEPDLGTGGSDLPDLPAEFSRLPHARGTIGAARSQNPNSANSQFFINFKDNSFLNGQYTVYGRVLSGMEHVDKIARGEPPANPDRMISVKVAADVA